MIAMEKLIQTTGTSRILALLACVAGFMGCASQPAHHLAGGAYPYLGPWHPHGPRRVCYVPDPVSYGYHATCWREWSPEWIGCPPCGELAAPVYLDEETIATPTPMSPELDEGMPSVPSPSLLEDNSFDDSEPSLDAFEEAPDEPPPFSSSRRSQQLRLRATGWLPLNDEESVESKERKHAPATRTATEHVKETVESNDSDETAVEDQPHTDEQETKEPPVASAIAFEPPPPPVYLTAMFAARTSAPYLAPVVLTPEVVWGR